MTEYVIVLYLSYFIYQKVLQFPKWFGILLKYKLIKLLGLRAHYANLLLISTEISVWVYVNKVNFDAVLDLTYLEGFILNVTSQRKKCGSFSVMLEKV